MLDIQMNIDDLVKFIFLENTSDTSVYLNLQHGENGIRNAHDLFTFCVDTFCKGLVMLYGINSRLEVDSMSLEQFAHAKKKLGNAGIHASLEMTPAQRPSPPVIIQDGRGDHLEDFFLKIGSVSNEYRIRFMATH